MGIHSNAWQGLEVLIFGASSIGPMELEQALADASPSNEIKFHSFEDFADAHTFAKKTRNFGLILICGSTAGKPTEDVIRELAKPYESRGLPAFAGLLYDEPISLDTLRAAKDERVILVESLSKTVGDGAGTFLAKLWNEYATRFEKKAIPMPLQETLLSVANTRFGSDVVSKYLRLIELTSSEFNLSWLDTFKLSWFPILAEIEKTNPEMLQGLKGLTSQVGLNGVQLTKDSSSIIALATNKDPLWLRLSNVFFNLSTITSEDGILLVGSQLKEHAVPGSSAVIRRLNTNFNSISEILSTGKSRLKAI